MNDTITCNVIDLYRYQIYYNEDNGGDEYTFTIVSDSIDGLVKGIVEREQVYSMKDCRKYFEIDEFLLVPREDEKFLLFDVNEHNLSTQMGLILDERLYECYFDGVPTSVDSMTFYSALDDLNAAIATDTEFMRDTFCYGALGDALYESSLVKEELARQVKEEEGRMDVERDAAHRAISRLV